MNTDSSTVIKHTSIVSTKLRLALLACACGLATSSGFAGTSYNEAVSGDLSNSGSAATLLPVSAGQNQVLGTTGRASGVVDRDYFTFTVPAGLALTSIVVLPGTTSGGGGGVSFIAMEAGNTVTLPTSASTAAGLLGWSHYGPGFGNILPDMAIPANGSSGFTVPLPAGDYAFWVQELSTGSFAYGFEFNLDPVASVPDSGPGLLGCTAVGALLALGRRRLAQAA